MSRIEVSIAMRRAEIRTLDEQIKTSSRPYRDTLVKLRSDLSHEQMADRHFLRQSMKRKQQQGWGSRWTYKSSQPEKKTAQIKPEVSQAEPEVVAEKVAALV